MNGQLIMTDVLVYGVYGVLMEGRHGKHQEDVTSSIRNYTGLIKLKFV